VRRDSGCSSKRAVGGALGRFLKLLVNGLENGCEFIEGDLSVIVWIN
jgi:hypothetical protein